MRKNTKFPNLYSLLIGTNLVYQVIEIWWFLYLYKCNRNPPSARISQDCMLRGKEDTVDGTRRRSDRLLTELNDWLNYWHLQDVCLWFYSKIPGKKLGVSRLDFPVTFRWWSSSFGDSLSNYCEASHWFRFVCIRYLFGVFPVRQSHLTVSFSVTTPMVTVTYDYYFRITNLLGKHFNIYLI